MDKLKIVSHSLTDWEFEPGNEYYLDETIFVSPPSSLAHPLSAPLQSFYYAFLLESVSGAINDGMFITAHRIALAVNYFNFWFRQSNDLTSCQNGGTGNGYRVRLDHANHNITLDRNGAWLHTWEDLPYPGPEEWYLFKLLWYSYINPNLDRILRIWPYICVNLEWQDLGYFEDSNPWREDEEHQRVGFALEAGLTDRRTYADDTQIWKYIK